MTLFLHGRSSLWRLASHAYMFSHFLNPALVIGMYDHSLLFTLISSCIHTSHVFNQISVRRGYLGPDCAFRGYHSTFPKVKVLPSLQKLHKSSQALTSRHGLRNSWRQCPVGPRNYAMQFVGFMSLMT